MTHGSLFSGIGGFDLAAEWAGWQNIFNCEWEDFPRKVLKHHFPNAKQYGDIREFNATDYAGRIDILSGGFPCQPYSVAGKRKGKEDERHLWPEMLRVIRECSPRWIVGENVRGLVNWSGGLVFEEVCADLEACGYSVQPFILPAAGVNSTQRRDRVWFVANANDERTSAGFGQVQGANEEVSQRHDDTESRNAGSRFVTNAKNVRLRKTESIERERREQESNNGEEIRRSSYANGNGWNAPDTDGAGERQDNRQGKPRQFDQTRTVGNWENFPTESPLCGGDDGLPKRLDGITFPKWRRESIKAYGNAIVPQVALRIFEAIQEYEISTKSPPPRKELSPHNGK